MPKAQPMVKAKSKAITSTHINGALKLIREFFTPWKPGIWKGIADNGDKNYCVTAAKIAISEGTDRTTLIYAIRLLILALAYHIRDGK